MINRRRPQNPTQKEAGGGKMVANRYSCGDFSQLFSQQQQTQGATPLVKGHFHSHSDCGEYLLLKLHSVRFHSILPSFFQKFLNCHLSTHDFFEKMRMKLQKLNTVVIGF